MSDQTELEGVIEDAVNDAAAPEADVQTDTTVETTDVTTDAPVEGDTPAPQESSQAPAPGAADTSVDEEGDEFAKRFSLQPNSVTGRENRIPYSRVKKIVERAEKEARSAAKKEFDTGTSPKVAEYETKVKDYEGRLEKVAQFEHTIENRPKEFLDFLATLPAYKEFFAYINQLAASPQAQAQQPPVQQGLDLSAMPQPDQPLADGTKVYSMEGLQKLLAWQAQQVEDRTLKAAEEKIAKRYEPMEAQWQAEQRRQQAIPVIQKQIADARQWPGFVENEAEIIEVLKADQNISLEGAYRKVYIPKLQINRDEQRKSILEELKKKPASTSAPVAASKPTKEKAGPKTLEQIIAEAAETLKK